MRELEPQAIVHRACDTPHDVAGDDRLSPRIEPCAIQDDFVVGPPFPGKQGVGGRQCDRLLRDLPQGVVVVMPVIAVAVELDDHPVDMIEDRGPGVLAR